MRTRGSRWSSTWTAGAGALWAAGEARRGRTGTTGAGSALAGGGSSRGNVTRRWFHLVVITPRGPPQTAQPVSRSPGLRAQAGSGADSRAGRGHAGGRR